MTAKLKHDALGQLTGRDNGVSVEYRGVPFATLEHPFAESVIYTNDEHRDIDATEYG